MILNFKQLSEYGIGAAGSIISPDGLEFLRFDRLAAESFGVIKNYAYFGSGTGIEFRTNARKITLQFCFKSLICTDFCRPAIDIFEDGKYKKSPAVLPQKNLLQTVEIDGNGVYHDFRILLPYQCRSVIKSFEIEDGEISPVKPARKTLLVLADSLWQGFYTSSPRFSPAQILAELLDANLYNLCVGGSGFCEGFLVKQKAFPDYILVSLGTNDITSKPQVSPGDFFTKLKGVYPHSKIIAITPFKRYDITQNSDLIAAQIKAAAARLEDILIIDGKQVEISRKQLLDGVHFNDTAAQSVARFVFEKTQEFFNK